MIRIAITSVVPVFRGCFGLVSPQLFTVTTRCAQGKETKRNETKGKERKKNEIRVWGLEKSITCKG